MILCLNSGVYDSLHQDIKKLQAKHDYIDEVSFTLVNNDVNDSITFVLIVEQPIDGKPTLKNVGTAAMLLCKKANEAIEKDLVFRLGLARLLGLG